MKILTFNYHESYLWALAKTGHDFELVEQVGGLSLRWNDAARPRPSNMRIVAFDAEVKGKLRRGEYDLVVVHTIENLKWIFPYFKARFIFVAHTSLYFHSRIASVKSWTKKATYVLFRKTHSSLFLGVSEMKQKVWNEKGEVVVNIPAEVPELVPGEGYDRIIVIGNRLAERHEVMGYTMVRELSKELPISVVGNNPGVTGAVQPKDFAEFCDVVRRARIYLYTSEQPWNDGYNMAMLEAMAMGMAVVTVFNPSSPIEHGVNGLVGQNMAEIRAHLKALLDDRALVDRLGAAARETVREHFTMEGFVEGWQRAIAKAVGSDHLRRAG